MSISSLLVAVKSLIEDKTSLNHSPIIIDSRMDTNPSLDSKFTLDFQTRNTDKLRDRAGKHARLSHTLSVRFLKRIVMNQQFQSQVDALTIEESVILAMMSTTSLPDTLQPVRVSYRQTSRLLTPSREYMVVQIDFDIEQDIALAS
jgi:hypothetical protein